MRNAFKQGCRNPSSRSGDWQRTVDEGIRGKTLGVLGLGHIGSEVARIALAFGMEVIGWSENLTPEIAESHVARADSGGSSSRGTERGASRRRRDRCLRCGALAAGPPL